MKKYIIAGLLLVTFCSLGYGETNDELFEKWRDDGVESAMAGNLKDAKVCFEAALTFKPNDTEVNKALRMIEERLDETSKSQNATMLAEENIDQKNYPMDSGAERVRFGAFICNNTIEGDFDDTMVLIKGIEVIDIPEIESGTGFGIFMGFGNETTSLDFSYMRSVHDTKGVMTGNHEAAFNMISMDFKYYVLSQHGFRPYLAYGLGIPWLTIENILSSDGGTTFDQDANFVGISMCFGGGIAYDITSNFAVNIDAGYRWVSFSSVEGNEIDDELSASGVTFGGGVVLTF